MGWKIKRKRKFESDSPKTKAVKKGKKTMKDDRISQLHDEIIVNILGFLSLKEAAGTSVLSKRWMNVWKHVVRLDFDDSKTLDRMAAMSDHVRAKIFRRKATKKYVKWVEDVLLLHEPKALDTFRICFDVDKKKFQANIDKWLHTAFAKRVERLELNLFKAGRTCRRQASKTYDFPSELLGIISWNPKESPDYCGIDIRSGELLDFKYLRALTFRCVNVSKEVLEFFLRSCPFLEHLAVDGSHHLKDNFEVSGASLALKYLEIWDCLHLSSIAVTDVNIVSLKVSDAQKLVLKNVPMLVNVWVSARSMIPTPLLDRLVNGSWLSPCILQLEILTLQATYLDVRREKANDVLPELFRLKHFTLVTEVVKDNSLIPFTSLIRASPNLEKFVLKLGWRASIRYEKGRKTRRGSNNGTKSRESNKGITFPLKHLKLVELLGYYGRTAEVELVEYFLENATALESIIIDPHDYPVSGRLQEYQEEEKFAREHAKNQLKPLIPSNVEFMIRKSRSCMEYN